MEVREGTIPPMRGIRNVLQRSPRQGVWLRASDKHASMFVVAMREMEALIAWQWMQQRSTESNSCYWLASGNGQSLVDQGAKSIAVRKKKQHNFFLGWLWSLLDFLALLTSQNICIDQAIKWYPIAHWRCSLDTYRNIMWSHVQACWAQPSLDTSPVSCGRQTWVQA